MRSDFRTVQRAVFLLLALLWAVPGVLAEVSHETLERLADIQVETYRLDHLEKIGKITPEERIKRRIALQAEEAALWKTLPQSTHADAESAVQGLGRTKLSLLEPQWDKEAAEFRKAAEEKNKQTARDLEADARRAAEIQRQRLALQNQLDKGAIDRDTFGEKDRAAVAVIGDLRKKYDTSPTGRWTSQFDSRLETLTRTLTDPPKTTAPKPPVTAGQGNAVRPPATPRPAPAPAEPWYTTTLSLWIFGAAGVLLLWWLGSRQTEQPAEAAPPVSDTYGTAQWAKHQHIPSGPTAVARGVLFGKSSRPELPANAPGAPIASTPESHVLIVARTRAGKGTRILVPTLLRYDRSMIVIDPKGENAAITARTRRDQLHHAVHIVNPWGELEGLYKDLGFSPAAFNPLDAIDRTDPNAVSVAQSLAATICPVREGKEAYWQGSAANVLTGVLLWLADTPGEEKTLARAREIVTQSRDDFKKILVRMMTSTAFHGAVKEMVSQYIDLAPETYSGIMSNLAESTKFLSDPRIKASTRASTFSMQKLRDEFMTVYLVIPHDRIQTHSTWLRLIIAAVMQALKNRTRDKTPPKHRCMFLIDEFGSIGHIADVPRDIAIMSGFGLDFTFVVQGLDQLKAHYGDAQGTILSNCGYKWFCNVADLETAKYLSESLGKSTVRTTSTSRSTSETQQGTTESESTSYGETGRPLLTPDEILNLGREKAILLHPFSPPHYLRPVDYWKLADTFAYLKPTHPQLYWWPEPLKYDPNPYWQPPGGDGSKAQPTPKMTDKTARQILGVGEKATRKEILAAYTRLIKKVHPDVGGSDYFAAQLNAAKAFLLGE